MIQLDVDGIRATAAASSTDIVEASARAYLAAVNKIVRMRERPQQERERVVGP